jgi:hypothetical protein
MYTHLRRSVYPTNPRISHLGIVTSREDSCRRKPTYQRSPRRSSFFDHVRAELPRVPSNTQKNNFFSVGWRSRHPARTTKECLSTSVNTEGLQDRSNLFKITSEIVPYYTSRTAHGRTTPVTLHDFASLAPWNRVSRGLFVNRFKVPPRGRSFFEVPRRRVFTLRRLRWPNQL